MKGEGRGARLGRERKQAARRGEKSGEREFWAGEESCAELGFVFLPFSFSFSFLF